MTDKPAGRTLPVGGGSPSSAADDGRPRLVVVEGAARGAVLVLARVESTVGRLADNDLVLESPAISKRHARIAERDGSFWISDLDSTNGVIVDGRPLDSGRERELRHGDAIRIGDHLVLFWHRPGDAGATTEPDSIQIDRERAAAEAEAMLRDLAPKPADDRDA